MFKKNLLVILAITILSLFTISCDNGSSDAAIAAAKTAPVAVSINMDLSASQKVISVEGAENPTSSVNYKIKAVPQWISDSPIYGRIDSYTRYTPNTSLYFAQGLWKIYAQAYSGEFLVCEGSVETYINHTTTSIQIEMGQQFEGTGTFDIEISVPRFSEDGGRLTLDYCRLCDDISVLTQFTVDEEKTTDMMLVYTGELEVTTGTYVLQFFYGDGVVGYSCSRVVVATAIANETVNIRGDIEAGQFIYPRNESFNFDGTINQPFIFYCLGDTSSTYSWTVNGEPQDCTKSYFTYKPTARGDYTVVCKVDNDNNKVATVVLSVEVEINVNLHLNNKKYIFTIVPGTKTASDYANYINSSTTIYDGSWYNAAENGSGGGGSSYTAQQVTNLLDGVVDVDLYAHRKYCTITLDANGGTGGTSFSKYMRDTFGTISDASKADQGDFSYTFVGWYTAAAGGTKVTANSLVTGTATYYAHFTHKSRTSTKNQPSKPNSPTGTYTVEFYSATFTQGASGKGSYTLEWSETVTAGQSIRKPSVSYFGNFIGDWYSQIKTKGKTPAEVFCYDPIVFPYTPTDSICLYGTTDLDGVTVTFNSNGGSDVASQITAPGGTLVKPENPTMDGHIFGGWFKESTLTTHWNFDTDTVPADRTLYAKWLDPAEYCENKTTGGRYINTGIVPTKDTTVVIDFNYLGNTNTTIIGAGSTEFAITTSRITRVYQGNYNNGEAVLSLGRQYDTGKKQISFSASDGLEVEGLSCGIPSPGVLTTSNKIYVFSDCNHSQVAVGKCYSVKIYNGSELVCDLVPVDGHGDDNSVGMFDTVKEVFYPGEGGSPFTDD